MSENEETEVKKGLEVNPSSSKKKEKIKPWVIDLDAAEAMQAKLDSYRPACNIDLQPKPGHPDEYIFTRDGLPHQAFAYVGNRNDPHTWLLPHHSPAIFRAMKSKISRESTVDWSMMKSCVRQLVMRGFDGQRVTAVEIAVMDAARHLADHYWWAFKPLPNDLTVLI